MYALGDTVNKLYNIAKQFLCDTLTTNNYGLILTTSQYLFYFAVKNLLLIDSNYKFDIVINTLYHAKFK